MADQATPDPEPLRVVELTVRDVMAARAVTITPDPDESLVVIGGDNAQGKTSTLAAMAAALGAPRKMTDPVRHGAAEGSVTVNLGAIVVTRTWTEAGDTNLEIRTAAGGEIKAPSRRLAELMGPAAIDPLAFAAARPQDRITTLCRVVGLDIETMDRQRQELYDRRTVTGRQIKSLEGQLDPIKPPDPALPAVEVDVADLAEVLAARTDEHAQRRALVEAASSARDRLAVLDRQLAQLQADRDAAAARAQQLADTLELADELPDLDEARVALQAAKATNTAIREAASYRRLNAELIAARRQRDEETEAIAAIDRAKAEALASADLPVAGLGIGDDDVTLGGVAFGQLSSAQQLEIACAVEMAAHPAVRVILADDGSRFDLNHLAWLRQLAADRGYQVWTTRASKGPECSVLIADGTTVERE